MPAAPCHLAPGPGPGTGEELGHWMPRWSPRTGQDSTGFGFSWGSQQGQVCRPLLGSLGMELYIRSPGWPPCFPFYSWGLRPRDREQLAKAQVALDPASPGPAPVGIGDAIRG